MYNNGPLESTLFTVSFTFFSFQFLLGSKLIIIDQIRKFGSFNVYGSLISIIPDLNLNWRSKPVYNTFSQKICWCRHGNRHMVDLLITQPHTPKPLSLYFSARTKDTINLILCRHSPPIFCFFIVEKQEDRLLFFLEIVYDISLSV